MSNLSDQIVDLLAPAIGKNMALASVKSNCKKMGITPEILSSKHIDEFIKNITPGLNVFAGNDFAEKTAAKMRQLR